MALEISPRRLPADHLSQVLATFALILIADELVRMIWARRRCCSTFRRSSPDPSRSFPARRTRFRAFIIVVGLVRLPRRLTLVVKTRVGAMVRAGASNREMALALGGT